MKNFITYLFFTWGSVTALGQVGIGTVNPQQTLHIAGENSTIRIESLNSTNSDLNDGIKLAPAYVDGDGDITLFGSVLSSGNPINILYSDPNFIVNDPYGHGTDFETGVVLNNDTVTQTVDTTLASVSFNSPRSALLEVRYGVTTYVRGSDLTQDPSTWIPPTAGEAIQIKIYFYVDFYDDNSGPELTDIYGLNGVYYETLAGGLAGYPYINGQGYMEIPAGDHRIYFVGSTTDHMPSYTSVGFGGENDYLKIRVFE